MNTWRDPISQANLLGFVVYHELEPLPFPDFKYSGYIKPEEISINNGQVSVATEDTTFYNYAILILEIMMFGTILI